MNPNQMINQIINSQFANNPIMSNAINLYKNGNVNELESLVRNVAKERGIDVDQFKNQAMQRLK